MLGLELRKEFKGRRLKGTAIELSNKNQTGATQIPASEFLDITYPTTDVLKTIEAVSPDMGRPVILKGERGQGKSHLMGMIYHAFTDNKETSNWLAKWSIRLNNKKVNDIQLRSGMLVISESMHRQHYKYLWDLLFDQHPHGSYCKGKWESIGDRPDIPSDDIMLEMFKKHPTALILDEFQTWFDGLTNTKQYPWRNWAFNFIQILSEIAKEHPDLLVLIISVRNGNTDAFQQVQRVNPAIIDFKGPSAKNDRLRLLLHRLFENRVQVAEDKITNIIKTHISEYIRLKDIAPAEQQRTSVDFIRAWPFAPHLMDLLEDQVLVATHAQETRDLIRILAELFKKHGKNTPIITAANFRLDDDKSGISSLLDSVANQHNEKLRDKALRNLESVKAAITNTSQKTPNLAGIIGALWLRSLAVSNLAGAEMETLHVDVTLDKSIDDNAFSVELSTIVENSFNIHEDGNRYIFREEENPQAKLIASARNDKLFQHGEDIARLSKEVRYVVAGSTDIPSPFRVIVLPQNWASNPWDAVEDPDHPNNWDNRIPIIVLPEMPDILESALGEWLKDNLQNNRNVVRFLLTRDGSENIYADRDLIIFARAVYLGEKWKIQNSEYSRLQLKYQKELRGILRVRFDRFAIISNWNFQEPEKCRFIIESHRSTGNKIPEAIDKHIRENLFIPEDFERVVLNAAKNNEAVGKLLREQKEPRPGGMECIPWLGETLIKERIIRLCAKGSIAINLRGMEYLQLKGGESEDVAWRRMKGKLGIGKHLDETYILLPQAVPATSGVTTSNRVPPSGTFVEAQPPITPGGTTTTPTEGQSGGQPQPGGNLFDGIQTFTSLSTPATSALNLLGKVEGWGIGTGTQLKGLKLGVEKLTGAQLQDLLKKLPDGITYEMGVKKEED
jgi:hypothetical protein